MEYKHNQEIGVFAFEPNSTLQISYIKKRIPLNTIGITEILVTVSATIIITNLPINLQFQI